jgi:hypothetical protein
MGSSDQGSYAESSSTSSDLSPSDCSRDPSKECSRLSQNQGAEQSSAYRPANCDLCRHLEWERFRSDSGDYDWERVLKVTYLDLLVSMRGGCQTCTLLSSAISESSKPMLEDDVDFLEELESSRVRITLRLGYTTVLEVWAEDDLIMEPYFELELYTQAGRLCFPMIIPLTKLRQDILVNGQQLA